MATRIREIERKYEAEPGRAFPSLVDDDDGLTLTEPVAVAEIDRLSTDVSTGVTNPPFRGHGDRDVD